MKPLIAINLDLIVDNEIDRFRVNRLYLEAIQRAGGVPLLVPPGNEHFFSQQADGFLFIGGPDYSPSLYLPPPAPTHPTVSELHPLRQQSDVQLMKHALAATGKRSRKPKPILGICGGMQLLNIVLGGTLYLDLSLTSVKQRLVHKVESAPYARHDVELEAGSRLRQIYGTDLVRGILTSHHQCVDKLGRALWVTGRAPDGIVEAVESTSRPFTIGVQWHPEVDFDINEPLFRKFVAACR